MGVLCFFVGHLTHKLNDYGGEEVLRSRCPLTVAFSCLVLCGFPPPLTATAVVPIESAASWWDCFVSLLLLAPATPEMPSAFMAQIRVSAMR